MKGKRKNKRLVARVTRSVHNKIIIQTLQLLRRAQIQTDERPRQVILIFVRVLPLIYVICVNTCIFYPQSEALSTLKLEKFIYYYTTIDVAISELSIFEYSNIRTIYYPNVLLFWIARNIGTKCFYIHIQLLKIFEDNIFYTEIHENFDFNENVYREIN